MAQDLALRADCSRCAALCCVGLHFDRSEEFAVSKAAGEPCRYLGAGQLGSRHRCNIHPRRSALGFGGCVGYDCLGAGQRVTQQLFGGRSWRADPALLGPMLDAFFTVRHLHELLELLGVARRLPLGREQRSEWRELERALAPVAGFGLAELERLELGPLSARLRAFLATLRPHASDAADGRRRLPLSPEQPRSGY
jgi:hypothetical protein